MQKIYKALYRRFKEAIPVDQQIETFPTQGSKIQPQQFRHRPDRRRCISMAAKNSEPRLQMPAYLDIIAGDIVGAQVPDTKRSAVSGGVPGTTGTLASAISLRAMSMEPVQSSIDLASISFSSPLSSTSKTFS